jgi:hypothetical protein
MDVFYTERRKGGEDFLSFFFLLAFMQDAVGKFFHLSFAK